MIFFPKLANLDPAHAEFLGCYFASMAKILRNLIGDYGNSKW